MIWDDLKKHLEWAEGRRKFPYEDIVGKLSIAVGRNLDDRGLRDDEIDLMLKNDMHEAASEAMKLPYFCKLNDARQLVIVDMIFNMGLPRFLGFVNTNAALEAGDFETAANEMIDSKWYRQTGRRAQVLAALMRSGEWHA